MTLWELLILVGRLIDIGLALVAFYHSFIYPAYLAAMDLTIHWFWQASMGLAGWALTLLTTLFWYGCSAYQSLGRVFYPPKVVASIFLFSFLAGLAWSGTAHIWQDYGLIR